MNFGKMSGLKVGAIGDGQLGQRVAGPELLRVYRQRKRLT